MKTYYIGIPPEDEYTSRDMCAAWPNGTLHFIKCHGIRCGQCMEKSLYKVCPVCGAPLDMERGRPYVCRCGTPLWVCEWLGSPAVTRFVIINPIFSIEEDTI